MTSFNIRICLFLAICSPVTTYASDQNSTPLSAAEALAIDAKYYAESYGVSEDEAMRRILIMHDSSDQIKQLQQEYGTKISGIYFDQGKDFGLKVNLTGNDVPSDVELIRKASTSVKNILTHNLNSNLKKLGIATESLNKAQAKIGQNISAKVSFSGNAKHNKDERLKILEQAKQNLLSKIPSFEMIADNEVTGGATLYVKADNGSVQKIAESILNMPITVEVIPSGIVATHTRGGSKLVKTDNGNLHCMTGFVAKHSSGQQGVLTAGHCLKDNTPLSYTDKDGSKYPVTTVSSIFDSRGDLGFITASHATSTGQFYADNTANPRTVSAVQSRSGTRVASGTVTGSYICHLGQTSPTDQTLMQSCGEVSSINGQGSDGVGGNTYVIVKNTKSGGGTTYNPSTDGIGTLRCVGGDSGGPWFAYTTAYGIQSGCAWFDNAKKQTKIVVYTSLDYAGLVGATIVKN
ncbi:hypothetical protein [Acinetobacter sp.]|uniref:hypothetical protein n=1 Tax=Acinetobacter sp. TaxID=472 RepID=UPI0026096347|nr:hypothetical protein [uncultured Acinetobacter sp.]